jgi:hypothetical protein
MTIAALLDRFRLRLPGRIGSRRRFAGGTDSRIAAGSPRVSPPNTKWSPGSKRQSEGVRRPLVDSANSRAGRIVRR